MNEHNRPSTPQGNPVPERAPDSSAQQSMAGAGSSWAWSEPQDGGTQPLAGETMAGAAHSPETAPSPDTAHSPDTPHFPDTAQSAGWGAPPSGPQGWTQRQPGRSKAGVQGRWPVKRTLVVAGVAVVVVAGTAAGFYALGSAGSADAANVPLGQTDAGGLGGQQGQTVPGQGGLGQAGPGQMGGNQAPDGLGMAGGLNAAVHSEYVVLRNGAYVTMADQLGTVSDVSSNSLTVKSEDGFTRSYALDDDTTVAQGARQRGSTASTLTMADVTAGSLVRVTAIKDGDNYTAASIRLTTSTTSGQGSSSSGLGSTSGLGTSS
ncbi:hypothetical protein [Arthrobacter sp. cf158]|uniref:hypothetical protein n=1 Tax=Arthrobacter sp. cf158 TaxID=1761744 RepID=UPI001587A7F8|nr:hypothetical protein [Arthrobacter sp. cf158]